MMDIHDMSASSAVTHSTGAAPLQGGRGLAARLARIMHEFVRRRALRKLSVEQLQAMGLGAAHTAVATLDPDPEDPR